MWYLEIQGQKKLYDKNALPYYTARWQKTQRVGNDGELDGAMEDVGLYTCLGRVV